MRSPLPCSLQETHGEGPEKNCTLERGSRDRAPACSRPRAVLRCPGRRRGTHCAGSRAPGARPAAASESPAPSAPAPAPPSGSPAGIARRQPRHGTGTTPSPCPSRPPRHLSDVLVLAERSLQRREHLAHRHGAATSRPRGLPRRRRAPAPAPRRAALRTA